MNTSVIILAGGQGSRFGQKKQFLSFHGKELWKHIYDNAGLIIPKENIVVVGVDIEGGATRPESVKKGLQYIKENCNCSKVVILEAARPLVSLEQLKLIIQTDAPSISFVNPVVDTIILADKTYLTRSECFHLVSPQAFDFNLLYNAYSETDLSEIRTDETRLINDVFGIKPTLLEGGENLFKVTYPKDIVILESIIKRY
jgi:2-C-methyl-D-erythritol 4-phosphate cytidylyltransferase